MNTVHVRRLAIHCRVDSMRESERARARRIFQDEIASALEDAVAQSGIGADEEVCIRTLRLSSRLWMGLTDDALRRAWAESLAAQIRNALANSDTTSVMRYGSSREAVVDALRSIARADFSRQWAWEQLRLTTPIAPGGRRADVLCQLLLSQPEVIVTALRAMRDEPAFWQLLAALEDEQVEQIADAALAASGITLSSSALATGDTATLTLSIRAQLAAAGARTAALLRRPVSRQRSVALAVLSILEAEPTLLRGDAAQLRGAIAALLGASATASQARPDRIDSTDGDPARTRVTSEQHHEDVRQPRRTRQAITDDAVIPDRNTQQDSAAHRRDTRPGADPETFDAAAPVRRDERGTTLRNRFEPQIDERLDDSAAPDRHDDDSAATTIDNRVRARSDWAGLLLLLNVLRDDGLIDPLLDDPELAQHSSSWVLHRLALALVPADPRDAAVLAFAGLDARRCPPEFFDETAAATEQIALLHHARLCIERTRARFDDGGDEVIYSVCARPGEIVADPGWIEIRFPLSTINVEVRRAGLDVDPGYVAWLGMVVKFAYV